MEESERSTIDSRSLRSVRFDADHGTLEIEFQNGGIYRYAGVPADLYEQLMHAPSKGQFFQTHIREKFSYTRIGAAERGD